MFVMPMLVMTISVMLMNLRRSTSKQRNMSKWWDRSCTETNRTREQYKHVQMFIHWGRSREISCEMMRCVEKLYIVKEWEPNDVEQWNFSKASTNYLFLNTLLCCLSPQHKQKKNSMWQIRKPASKSGSIAWYPRRATHWIENQMMQVEIEVGRKSQWSSHCDTLEREGVTTRLWYVFCLACSSIKSTNSHSEQWLLRKA